MMVKICALMLATGLLMGCAGHKTPSQEEGASIGVPPGETGGSAAGDLGPPQGDPIEAILTDPPYAPPPINRTVPKKVVVNLEVQEVVKPISDGVEYTFWTFGGVVPGKFIRVRQGDTVEFNLANHPDSKMPHNIDLHAVTGPGGGAEASFTLPGKQTTFTFKALNQGLYVYHCAVSPVGMHVANGMYGLILVEPPEGLPPVDREFYVMQGDFYTVGKYREQGLQDFDMQKAIDENATYVLFNGSEGAITGENALQARVGETIRLFMGNGGPNLVSSFHVIGEIFDKVFAEGGTRFQENVQTTLIPAGGSAIVEFKVEVPGTLILVDHSIFRAFNKGAIGMLKVEGPENESVFTGRQAEVDYQPKTRVAAFQEEKAAAPELKNPLEKQITAGSRLYGSACAACHQANGQGLPGVFPPLAQADYLMADKIRSIDVVLYGLSGPITVNNQQYTGVMPPMNNLSDEEIANILTFVRNSWGNKGEAVTPAEVQKQRATGKQPVGAVNR